MIPERECAFINFLNVEDATKAKTALNGGHIGSCIIKIAYGKVDISAESIANNASKSLCIFFYIY
jgi:protein JSN1